MSCPSLWLTDLWTCVQLALDGLSEMFSGAHDIMWWLADCAARIAKTNEAVGWVTPLGLPVVQPYRSLTLPLHPACNLLLPVAVAHCPLVVLPVILGSLSSAPAVLPLQALLSSIDSHVVPLSSFHALKGDPAAPALCLAPLCVCSRCAHG